MYKVVSSHQPLMDGALNSFYGEGWELIQVFVFGVLLYYHFKRRSDVNP